MAEETRLDSLLVELNEALGDVTPYKLAVVAPGKIRPVEKNAHYMSKRVYDQLVNNVQQDGNLSSLPFCWRDGQGAMISLSGNHRVEAAQRAGVEQILVLYTDAELSKPEQLAIQLSHNALVGQDNPTTLRELWDEIDDLRFKVYSGLDEDLLETMEPMTIAVPNEAALRFEELVLLFLPAEVSQIELVLKQLTHKTRKRLAARVEDFDRFFEALLQFKEAQNIVNTSTAFIKMIELVQIWLDEQNAVEHESQE